MKTFSLLMIILASLFISNSELTAQKSKSGKVEVKVMYFHGPMRCQGCITIENETRATVNTLFSKELKAGSVKLEVIDFLAEGNEHFEKKYKLETQALIISKYVDGKETEWKNMDKIWDYSADPEKFSKYVSKAVNDYLK